MIYGWPSGVPATAVAGWNQAAAHLASGVDGGNRGDGESGAGNRRAGPLGGSAAPESWLAEGAPVDAQGVSPGMAGGMRRDRMRVNPQGESMATLIQNQFEQNFITTNVDHVFNWARKSALWPLTFGLACCAIEMIASSTSRFDIARFGAEVFRPSPRQSDLMIVAGTVTLKMAPVLKRIWDQMPDPKWCISMGACSSVGGPFNTYAVLQGVDKIVPVDVYVTGCPPRPENLFYALLKLQDKIDQMTTLVKRPTEVRLDESMLEEFKQQIRIAQIQNPA
jgi:NADH-quinone oxidoreductase subunit B